MRSPTLEFDTANECIKLFISKLLDFGIVLDGITLKVPQILKIHILLAYNFRSGNPFSTYGEMGFTTLQKVVILFLLLSYSKNLSGLLAFLVVYAATSVPLFNPDIVSADLLRNFQWQQC
ncbi:hypothetical protein PhCBS80983_g05257 [Powellomyces hirtus]|uniref:Uncharacterized protein n=1 Tax=Powellomyces hirtus TaxID=109895 RepID=A0A507DW30_9FUNG|nr:hypothetical protein PhCBS80983_g05257 [Powellomyces hirtus]